MALVTARVRPTHNYGFQPPGSIVHVEREELRRLPDVLELVGPEGVPAAVPLDQPEPIADAEEKEEQLAAEELVESADGGEVLEVSDSQPATDDGSAGAKRGKKKRP